MGDVPDDDPFGPLIAAHEDFVDKLTELEATLDEMMATREAREENQIIVDEAVRFFEEELVPHLRLEDEAVLPRLEKAIGRYGTLVNVVAYEHDEIRRGIGKFTVARDELRRDPDSWPKMQELNRHGIFLVQFLWTHFRKENTSLFPTARKVLSAEEIRGMQKQLSAV
jgi:hemerythrin-like domain-containing protein